MSRGPTGAAEVVIVGAGLSGLVVARELRRRGVPVRVLEASGRAGGKAGADEARGGGLRLDHGYHVFPGWYANTRALLADLGIEDALADVHCVHYLRRGEFPECRTLREMSSLRSIWKNLRSGLVPPRIALFASFYGLELALQRFSRRGYLDRVSANGFLRSRFYATEDVANTHQHFVLQASSIPNYEISAMTARRITQAWFRVPAPIFSILRTDLQTGFIEPLERDVRGRGATIETGRRVVRLDVRGARVRAVELEDGSRVESSVFVLATPLEITRQLFDAELVRAELAAPSDAPRLASLFHLATAPMAALHVFFRRRLVNIPREHTVLFDSEHELSFVDISQWWDRLCDRSTLLSCIASDIGSIQKLPAPEAARILVEELHSYMPDNFKLDEDVDWTRTQLRSNAGAPLFLNTVGSWAFRPDGLTRIPNLFVTGDYCRSTADLTTMESAVESGISTARHLLTHLGLDAEIPRHRLDAPLGLGFHLLRWLGWPLVHGLALPTWLGRRLAWMRSGPGSPAGAAAASLPRSP